MIGKEKYIGTIRAGTIKQAKNGNPYIDFTILTSNNKEFHLTLGSVGAEILYEIAPDFDINRTLGDKDLIPLIGTKFRFETYPSLYNGKYYEMIQWDSIKQI